MAKLDDLAIGRANNFNLIRMIAATAVLVSHAYPISLGEGALEPLSLILHFSLGTLAVLTFFAISGFFISQSFDRKNGLVDFWVARFLRIYPGLTVVLLLAALVLGPIFTTLSKGSYFLQPATIWYLPRNLSLKWLQDDLPGVFSQNPYGTPINGSLWSLFYEVACYCIVAIIGTLSLTQRNWTFVSFLVVYGIAYVTLKFFGGHFLEHGTVANFHELTLPFILGMAFYHFRRILPMNLFACVILCVATLVTYDGFWFKEVFVISWCYIIFYLGYLPFARLKVYNHLGDYSYGMYIYAFPCEQIGAALWKNISPLALIAISFPITLIFAMASWHYMESWALNHRATMAYWLRRTFGSAPRFSHKQSPISLS